MLSSLIAFALAAAPAHTAPEGPLVTVLDDKLHATTGTLVSVRDGTATVRTEGKETAVQKAVAVVAAEMWGPQRDWPGLGEDAPPAGNVTVQLTDGSRLRGDLLAGKGDGLVLVHRTLGKVEFPLDTLARLETRPTEPSEAGGKRTGDTVRLINGDRFDGFIESIAAGKGESQGNGLAVTIEHDKTKTAVPLERVAWAALGGGTKTAPTATVWLAGGEQAGVVEFSTDALEARVVRAKGSVPANVRVTELRGTLLAPSAVSPLAACTVRSGGMVERGAEQSLGTRDLTLPEPEQVAFELPKGARRVTGWAVLPEECRRLGDCTVRIAAAGADQSREKMLAEFTLNGASPIFAVNVELPTDAAWLSVTVGEGKNGPVQDRVVLRRVLVGK
ncbi:MAG: hypothetical protein QM783_17155 [Phycisphaerales bacterium]